MQNVELFVNTWVNNKYTYRKLKPYGLEEEIDEEREDEESEKSIEESEEEFFESLPSPLLHKTLIIERNGEDEIDFNNDRNIRFVYDRGVVQLYKNNVENHKVGNITFDLLDLLDKKVPLLDWKCLPSLLFIQQ
jgi:hypothetical protein